MSTPRSPSGSRKSSRDSKIADPEKFHDYIKEQSGMAFEDFQPADEELHAHPARHPPGSQRPDPDQARRSGEILQRAQDRVHPRGAHVPARDSGVHRKQGCCRGGGRREESQGPGGPRAARESGSPKWLATIPMPSPPRAWASFRRYKKGELAKNLEDLVWDQPKGYVTDPINTVQRLSDPARRRTSEGRPSRTLRSRERSDGQVAPRRDASRPCANISPSCAKTRSCEIKPDWVDSGAAPGKDTAWVDPAQLKPETVTKEEVASQTRHKRLLWMVPIPGTQAPGHQPSQ